MDMPEKLELIAKCLREGRQVEFSHPMDGSYSCLITTGVSFKIYRECEYRAKPNKPRVVSAVGENRGCYDYVELTPEVRKALEDAGIEI